MRIILEKKEDEQQREQYIKNTITQYEEATGKKSQNKESIGFAKSYLEWAKNRRKIGLIYKKLLIDIGMNLNSRNIAEVNKGFNDTIVYNENTRVITSYPYNVYGQKFQSKIIKAYLRIAQEADSSTFPSIEGIDTFITHNPYNETDIQNWSELFNTQDYGVTVGIFGNNYDMDKPKKVALLKLLREQIVEPYQMIEAEDNNIYSYILTNNLTRRKSI